MLATIAAIGSCQEHAARVDCAQGMLFKGHGWLTLNRVAVEKLLRAKFAKIKLRQDALQTTFSIFLDIFYPPNFRCFEENGVFQQPLAITLIEGF